MEPQANRKLHDSIRFDSILFDLRW